MSLNPRPECHRSRAHLDYVKQLPCVACACEGKVTHGCDPAHVSFLQPRGMGMKTGDQHTAPLCRPHHDEQHRENEALWWGRLGVDVRGLCAELWDASGELVEGETIVGAYAQARRRIHRLRPAGELLEPVTLSRTVLVEATTSDARDGDGNIVVHLPVLGPRGTVPARVCVDPNSLREADRG